MKHFEGLSLGGSALLQLFKGNYLISMMDSSHISGAS